MNLQVPQKAENFLITQQLLSSQERLLLDGVSHFTGRFSLAINFHD
jgi:hypothetical protein